MGNKKNAQVTRAICDCTINKRYGIPTSVSQKTTKQALLAVCVILVCITAVVRNASSYCYDRTLHALPHRPCVFSRAPGMRDIRRGTARWYRTAHVWVPGVCVLWASRVQSGASWLYSKGIVFRQNPSRAGRRKHTHTQFLLKAVALQTFSFVTSHDKLIISLFSLSPDGCV